MEVSVVVCTYNRCASVAETIAALSRQVVRTDTRWELIVVDNNSTDRTRETVGQLASEPGSPEIRYAFEAQQGLSHARNHGIALARGELILFTDDDVIPEPDWVQTVADAMRDCGCDACGGYIAPIWEAEPPAWLTERFYGFLALKPDPNGPRILSAEEELPFGANMAFRREVFERVGLFDPGLGRMGNVLAGGEESDLFRRILGSGGSVMYFPQARVHHKVEAFRTRKRYFRRWRFQGSRNLASRGGIRGSARLNGVPLYIFGQLGRSVARALRYRISRPADEAFRQEMIVWHFLGLIAGSWGRSSPSSR